MAKKQETAAPGAETPASKSAPLPLFYSHPVPLDGKKHQNASLKKNFGLSFCSHVNAVPINMIEMPQVSHFYPIAFSPDENATPVALLGVRDNETCSSMPPANGWKTPTSPLTSAVIRSFSQKSPVPTS